MTDRMQQLVQQAAPTPTSLVDPHDIWSRGVRMRRRRQVGAVMVAGLLVGGTLASFQPWQAGRVDLAGPAAPGERSGTGLAVLDRPERPDDIPPAGVLESRLGADVAAVQRVRLARQEDGVHYYLALMEDSNLCLVVWQPETDLGVGTCAPLERAVQRPGNMALGGGVIAGTTRYVGVIRDGYNTATSADRSWPISGNLLVIVDDPMPEVVEVRGPAGSHQVHVGLLVLHESIPTEELQGLLRTLRGTPVYETDSYTIFQLSALDDPVTPARVAGARVFLVRQDAQVMAFLARAQHLEDEGLWWCPDERVFVSPAHGELFGLNGTAWDGPAARDLDRLPVTLQGEYIVVHASPVDPGQPLGRGDASQVLSGQALEVYKNPPWGDAFCANHIPDDEQPRW